MAEAARGNDQRRFLPFNAKDAAPDTVCGFPVCYLFMIAAKHWRVKTVRRSFATY